MQTRALHASAVLAGFLMAGTVFAAVVARLAMLKLRIGYEGTISLGADAVPWLALPWAAFVAMAWLLPEPVPSDAKLAFLHRAMRWLAIAAPVLALLFLIFAGPSIRWRS